MGPKVLVVEDEPAIRELLSLNLAEAGYRVECVADGLAALDSIASAPPDVLLLDWLLPGPSGLRLLETLRGDPSTRALPVIMVTARSSEADRIAGFDALVDDYVTKPFSLRELKARIASVLRRRAAEAGPPPLTAGGVVLDQATHRVTVGNATVTMGPIEFRLLAVLLASPRRSHTREQIIRAIWGGADEVEERTVDVHVRRLRAALEPHGQADLVETVRGVGYRLGAIR